MDVLRSIVIAAAAVAAIGVTVVTAPTRDWRSGLIGFVVSVACGTLAIYLATHR
jgi:hypothetical protein